MALKTFLILYSFDFAEILASQVKIFDTSVKNLGLDNQPIKSYFFWFSYSNIPVLVLFIDYDNNKKQLNPQYQWHRAFSMIFLNLNLKTTEKYLPSLEPLQKMVLAQAFLVQMISNYELDLTLRCQLYCRETQWQRGSFVAHCTIYFRVIRSSKPIR